MSTEIRLFISSKMAELRPEREAIYALLPTLNTGLMHLHAWVFEKDAPASEQSIREIYLDRLRESALYIGLFWNQYGEWTIDEFERAGEWGIDRHIYVKDVDAHERDPKLTEFLNQYGGVTSGVTAKWFKTLDELKAAVAQSLAAWVENRLSRRTSLEARILTDPDDLYEAPKTLIGRDEQLKTIPELLNDGGRVLIQAHGGAGKTALVATITKNWLAAQPGSKALWLQAGAGDAEVLFEALARPFGASQAVASADADAKIQTVRQLLRSSGAGLLVIDDAWNGAALGRLIKAVPSTLPLLVTARQRFEVDTVMQLKDLSDDAAAELLYLHWKPHSPTPVSMKPELSLRGGEELALCKALGNLAFAVEIAGKTLKRQNLTPGELLTKIKDAPHRLEGLRTSDDEKRANVEALIETSLDVLPEDAKQAFFAFGAFWQTALTPLMLALYFDANPEVDDELLAQVRANISEVAEAPPDELRSVIADYLLSQVSPEPAEKLLEILQDHGLAERISKTDNTIAYYRIHDLSYAYAREKAKDEDRDRALDACLAYTERYNTPSLTTFAALRPELDNFMGAAGWAFSRKRWANAERFAWNLYTGEDITGGILERQGYITQALRLLEQAAAAAEKRGNKRDQGGHLGNLGSAYQNLGQLDRAIAYYEQVLAIMREIGDRRDEGSMLGNLGLAYVDLAQAERAIDYLEQHLAIAREIGDRYGEGKALGNLGIAYQNLGQLDRAIEYLEDALAISCEIGDRRGEGITLNALGTVFANLGQLDRAIKYFEQKLAIVREIGDRRGEGSAFGNLGSAFANLGQLDRAIEYHQQALVISREVGDHINEARWLNNLGVAYETRGDYSRALEYYEQARDNFVGLNLTHLVKQVDENIAEVRRKMADEDAAEKDETPTDG